MARSRLYAIFASVYPFFSNSRDLQSPLSGGKKVCTFFFPPKKKEHLEVLGDALERPGGYQRLTLGQRSVNVGSTLGIFPSHRGPIFADFAGFVH